MCHIHVCMHAYARVCMCVFELLEWTLVREVKQKGNRMQKCCFGGVLKRMAEDTKTALLMLYYCVTTVSELENATKQTA